MTENSYIKIFASCIPVKGFTRSLICDLSRFSFDFIPNGLAIILQNDINLSLPQILQKYGKENESIILEYIDFLIEKDYIFLCKKEELDHFPSMKMHWKSPYTITNAIYDISLVNETYIYKIINSLSILGCSSLHIRVFNKGHIKSILKASKNLNTSRIKSVEIVLPYSKNTEYFLEKIKYNNHVFSVFIFSAPYEKIIEHGTLRVIYSTETNISTKNCGIIHPSFFAINIPTFTESQHHNTCLNRKISIDTDGNIKNCPSMQQSFGHISNTTLEEVIKNPAFTKMWDIKKDDIDKCKTCEFRHICTDCRAYLENPDDLYAAPLKCGYNPETCEWEEWSTNPLKEKAIEYYQLQSIL